MLTVNISDDLEHSLEIDGKAGNDPRQRPASSQSLAGFSMVKRKCSSMESLSEHS